MRVSAADLARRLAQNAEAVCREYLSNGRREGHTWRVGDADNTPGRSLAVRLTGPDSGKGAAGKWTDFATGEHGDLLDLIARNRRLENFRDVAEEARRFLSLPETVPIQRRPPAPAGSPGAARRLFASARPIHGSIAETYLRNRGISELRGVATLRFHPNCFYRVREDAPRETWPALLAAVTDVHGTVTGVLRTWLERDGSDKAPLSTPRRAMGHLLGNGVRFGAAEPAPAQAGVVAVGEGLETMLSLRCVLPAMPMIAALSATHLAALALPPGLRRLYVARDDDRSGRRAAEMLVTRAEANGIEALTLFPGTDDFNTDLAILGRDALAMSLRIQLAPEDIARFLRLDHRPGHRAPQRSLSSGPPSPPAAPGLQRGDRARSG
jgi:hypothetical protein